MDAYLTTMYFVDPNIICAGGRTQEMFDTQGTGDRLIIQVQNDHINMIISLRLILEGWRYSHWQPRDSSPEQGGGRGWSRMVQSLLLYRDGGSLHPIWLHSRAGLSTDPASSGSWISCFFAIIYVTSNIWQLLFDDGYDGIISGFVWQHFVMIDGLDSGRWEHPDSLAIMGIVDRFQFRNWWNDNKGMIWQTSTMRVGRAGHHGYEHNAPLLLGLPPVHHVPVVHHQRDYLLPSNVSDSRYTILQFCPELPFIFKINSETPFWFLLWKLP